MDGYSGEWGAKKEGSYFSIVCLDKCHVDNMILGTASRRRC